MMKVHLKVGITKLAAIGLLVALVAPAAAAEHWSRFRGPNGTGISAATTVPISWTEDDYQWNVELRGLGHSSPVVWGDKVFVTSCDEAENLQIVWCLDAHNGATLWSREFPCAEYQKNEFNSFASSTPTVDAQHVYISWIAPEEYTVLALDHSGAEAWRVSLGAYRASHGLAGSPILCAGHVIVPNDQDGESSVAALDRMTGQERWKLPRQSGATYATPCLSFLSDGRSELIFTSQAHGITAVDPTSGKSNWELDVFTSDVVASSPATMDDLIVGGCGGIGAREEIVVIQYDGSDSERKPSERYRLDKAMPFVPTPLIYKGMLFLWSDQGVVTCADVTNGEFHWRERLRGSFYASPICIGDRIYGCSTEGDVVVLAANHEFEELARNPLPEGTHSTPAVANGRMYIRTFSRLLAIGG